MIMRILIGGMVVAAAMLHAAVGVAAEPGTSPGQAGSVTVAVDGFRSDEGDARIALVNSEEQLRSEAAAPFRGGVAPISGGRAQHTFTGVREAQVRSGEIHNRFPHDDRPCPHPESLSTCDGWFGAKECVS